MRVFYKLLPNGGEVPTEEVMEGVILNLSQGGIGFRGKLPNGNGRTIRLLKEGKILIALNMFDISPGSRIKALSAFRWAVPVDSKVDIYDVGVEFKEIAASGSSEILRHIISSRFYRE
jgi:hypothetical protein